MDSYRDKYFNNLISQKYTVSKIERLFKILLKNREILSQYNPHLVCSTEKFIDNVNQPLSLKQTCLRYLHLNLAFKTHISTEEIFVNFLSTPNLIDSLNIPITLKKELMLLYATCASHCCLVAKIPKRQKTMRYKLKKNGSLSVKLNMNKHWPKHFNYKLYTLSTLLNTSRKLGITNIPIYEYHKISNYEIINYPSL